MTPSDEARFWEKVEKTDTCWLWTASCTRDGYGWFSVGGVGRKAHRISLELHLGRPLLPGMFVCHAPHSVCGHRTCVNPAHLSEKTNAENHADMVADGTSMRGARHPNCKLTEAQVRAIRADMRLHAVIAGEYGIKHQTVTKIKARKRWGWLEDEPAA